MTLNSKAGEAVDHTVAVVLVSRVSHADRHSVPNPVDAAAPTPISPEGPRHNLANTTYCGIARGLQEQVTSPEDEHH